MHIYDICAANVLQCGVVKELEHVNQRIIAQFYGFMAHEIKFPNSSAALPCITETLVSIIVVAVWLNASQGYVKYVCTRCIAKENLISLSTCTLQEGRNAHSSVYNL